MKIIITTGFEKVTNTIEFQPESEPKGKNLAESQHVREVAELREDACSFLIQARVIGKLQCLTHRTPPSSTYEFTIS